METPMNTRDAQRMSWMKRASFLVCFLSLQTGSANADLIQFSDDTFASWIDSVLSQAGPVTLIASQAASDGNPGDYWRIEHTYGGNSGGGHLISGHLNSGAIYNPAVQGALTSLDYEFDARVINGGASNGVAYGALLQQSGNVYIGGFATLGPLTSWTTLQFLNLTSANFGLVGAAVGQPNFSVSGAPITLGFFASNGTGNSSQTSTNRYRAPT
jgi:hypothetical protein